MRPQKVRTEMHSSHPRLHFGQKLTNPTFIRYITIALQLHHRYTAVTLPLHYSHIMLPRCLPPHTPLSTTALSTPPAPLPTRPMLRCLPPHAPLSTIPCPAAYHPMPRCLLPHAPLATTPYTHTWRSEGGACCGRGGENPTEACTYPRTGPGSRHGHGA